MAATPEFQSPRVFLAEQSKDELIDEILRLRKKNQELQKQLEDLKKQIKPAFIKISVYKKRKRWKKLGRPVGHPGCTRPKPEVIHHVVEQTLEQCPDCGGKSLSPWPSEDEEHIQEDIVLAHVEATKFIRRAYHCSHCQKLQRAPYASGEVPYGYLGPNILIQTILLKYHHGLSYSKMPQLFKALCGLTVTDSALAQALQRLAKWLRVEMQVIVEAARASPWIHGDETGWKIAGVNHWLWDFVNQKLALYQISRSRGKKVPEDVLGKDYPGIMLSDFLSAYDKSGKRKQRCYEEILTFLDVPGLPQDNNHAERMIRPNVIFRKISFQNMSRKGADAHEVLMSLLQTLRLQDKNPIEFFKTAYLRHRQENSVPLLSLLPSR